MPTVCTFTLWSSKAASILDSFLTCKNILHSHVNSVLYVTSPFLIFLRFHIYFCPKVGQDFSHGLVGQI